MKNIEIPELINRDKLIEIMYELYNDLWGRKWKLSADRWFDGWTVCHQTWIDTVKRMPNEIEAVEEWVKKEILEKIMAVPTSTADKEVAKTLKETTEHLSSASMELRPLFSKPKTEMRTLENVVDEVLYCKNCGAYVCYPTEHNARDEYRYCHHCGKLLDWDDVSMSEDYKKLEEVENENNCNKDI